MNIRFAVQKDKTQVLALMDELDKEIYMKRGQLDHKGTASLVGGLIFDEIVARSDTFILVAEENTKLVGLLNVYILPNIKHGYHRVHVEDVVVTKQYRRKGVGTALFQALKKYCKENNVSVIKLDSGLELPDAHKFYEKNGGKFTEKMFRFDL